MNCDETIDYVTDRLKGLIDTHDARELDRHLAGCDACRVEAESIERLWSDMGTLDEEVPSERMRSRFYAALHAYEAGEGNGLASRLRHLLERFWPSRPAMQLAITAAALVLGWVGGSWFVAPGSEQIESLRADVRAMESAFSLTLLEHGSASERLRAVQVGARHETDERVIESLLDVVANDPNVNVRLAAVEALAPLLDRPRVGRELLDAFERQTSPMIQVSLAELLLDAGVEGSRPAVERLLEKETVDPTVRDHLADVMRSTS
jgi:anti-sigma factor RsiW